MVTLGDYLFVSGVLFTLGFAGVLLRRNLRLHRRACRSLGCAHSNPRICRLKFAIAWCSRITRSSCFMHA